MSKPTIGLTGGIACGKSTVAGFFGELGVPVVDADQLAREVVAPGSPGLAQIVESFGAEMLAADGSLDRKKMGAVVFADNGARRQLEAITHPRIAQLGLARLQEARRNHGRSLRALRGGAAGRGRHAPGVRRARRGFRAPRVQLERLMARDGSTREQAQARIDSQLPVAEKVAVADHVIDNGGTLDQTREQVARDARGARGASRGGSTMSMRGCLW